jgi:hypothetical protein
MTVGGLHWSCIGGRSGGRTCGEAFHRLTQLRIDFVCDGHDSNQQQTEIDIGQIVL